MEDMINETISVATAIQEENKMKSGTPTDIHDIDFWVRNDPTPWSIQLILFDKKLLFWIS